MRLSRTAGLLFLVGAYGPTSAQTVGGPRILVPTVNNPAVLSNFHNLQSDVLANGQIEGNAPSKAIVGALQVKPNAAANSLEVVALPSDKVNATSADLARRISAEKQVSASALTELRDALSQNDVPALQTSAWQFHPATGNAYASATTLNLGADARLAIAIERAQASGLRVSASQLQLLPKSSRLEAIGAAAPQMRSLTAKYKDLLADIGTLLEKPTDATAKVAVSNQAQETFADFAENWAFYDANDEPRRGAVHALDGIARQSELKAIYGVNSAFPPASYENLYHESRRAVRINDPLGTATCSGLAVTPAWVLTAGHCFEGRSWTEMSAQFQGAGGTLSASTPILDVWPSPPRGSTLTDGIDYVFARVAPQPSLSSELSRIEGIIGHPVPLCLRQKSALYEEPVVVVAYDGNDSFVYDHAYVWYPFAVHDEDFKLVAAMTIIRLQKLAEVLHSDDVAAQNNFYREQMTAFRQAYSKTVGTGAQEQHQYWGKLKELQVDRPMFGFDTDTKHGNSGGPVISRMDNCIVGVFNGGRPDGVVIDEASWREHEFATPMGMLLTDMDSAATALAAANGDPIAAKRLELIQAIHASEH